MTKAIQKLLDKLKRYKKTEEFLFKFEKLPKFGKEYWYFHLVNPKERQQLLVTLGRAKADFKVRGKKLKEREFDAEKSKCAAVAWLYDGDKEVLIDGTADVEIQGQELIVSNKETEIRIKKGALLIKKGRKTVCDVKIKDPGTSRSSEIVSFFVDKFGGGMGNLFHVFRGRLNGKPFEGSAYLQKVVASFPSVPWHWVRLAFEDGSVFDLFNINIAGKQVFSRLNFYYAKEDRNHVIENIKINTYLEKEKWVAEKKDEVFLEASAYSIQPFVIKTIGEFHYDEYMIEAKDLEIKLGKKKITLEELGKGQGTSENAYGFTL